MSRVADFIAFSFSLVLSCCSSLLVPRPAIYEVQGAYIRTPVAHVARQMLYGIIFVPSEVHPIWRKCMRVPVKMWRFKCEETRCDQRLRRRRRRYAAAQILCPTLDVTKRFDVVCMSSSHHLPLPSFPWGSAWSAEMFLAIAVVVDEVGVGNTVSAIDFGNTTGRIQNKLDFAGAA